MKHHVIVSLLSISLFVAAGWAQTVPAEQKTNYAVVNLKNSSGVTEGESELISDRLRSELFNTGKVNVMERNQMQEILKEQGFQQSGACTDEACLVEMGQMLGVKILVVGSLGKLGSMFMINIRAIDVQTAQIVKVVSVDIKGDIEEVVEHLKEIAGKLTGMVGGGSPEPVVATPRETATNVAPEITAATSAKPEQKEAVVAPPEESKQEENKEKVATLGDKTEKNRNRGGIGLSYNLFGSVSHIFDGERSDSIYLDLNQDLYLRVDNTSSERTFTPYMDYLLRFYIRVGKFLNIEVGPHFAYGDETYSFEDYSYPSELFITYSVPGVHVGINYVKRLFPLKINAGAFFNFDVPVVYYRYDGYDPYGASFYDDDFRVTFRFVPGARAGAEILAGSHVGFSVDFLFQFMKIEMDFNFNEMGSDDLYTDPYAMGSPNTYTQEILFPLFGVGFGINFYF